MDSSNSPSAQIPCSDGLSLPPMHASALVSSLLSALGSPPWPLATLPGETETTPIRDEMMKLRVQSMVTKEMLRVEALDASSLNDLKILIASKLSPTVPPDSIDSPSIAPTRSPPPRRGDLLFFSLDLDPHTLSPTPTLIPVPENLNSNAPSQKDAILETASPDRCLTITSSSAPTALYPSLTANSFDIKIFIDDVEVTHPDLFNDGSFMIHGIDGFVAPLSPLSCSHKDPHPAFTLELATTDASALLRLVIVRLIMHYAIAAFLCTLAIATY